MLAATIIYHNFWNDVPSVPGAPGWQLSDCKSLRVWQKCTFEYHLCYLQTVGDWARSFISVCLSFTTYNTKVILAMWEGSYKDSISINKKLRETYSI